MDQPPPPPIPPPLPYASVGSRIPTAAVAGRAGSPMPTSPQEIQAALIAAQMSAKKIRKMASYATFDAWTIALFAAPSFICGLFSGASGVVLGMAMAAIAFIEFQNAAALRRLDPKAPRRLAYNQLAFAATLILYALWSLYAARSGGGVLAQLQQADPSVDLSAVNGIAGQADSLAGMVTWIMYGSLIAIAVFAQGGTAIYYLSREKLLREYIETTPAWVIEMQRAGSPL